MDTTVIVPTYNEGGNVRELVRQLQEAFDGQDVEVLFVDDSTDDTPDVIRDAQSRAGGHRPAGRLLHREPEARVGGLAGAVTAGIRQSTATHVLVMDETSSTRRRWRRSCARSSTTPTWSSPAATSARAMRPG